MSAESGVKALLLASPVSAVVGGRIYPVRLPQAVPSPSTMPAIVYQRVSGDHPVAQDGASGPNGIRMQLDLWGQTYDAVASLRGLVIEALNGKTSLELQGVFSETDADLYDDEVKLHRASLDFMAFEA